MLLQYRYFFLPVIVCADKEIGMTDLKVSHIFGKNLVKVYSLHFTTFNKQFRNEFYMAGGRELLIEKDKKGKTRCF